MAENTSPLDQLKSFLNQLFQFDSQDLDFGVYKILHYKRKEIKDFLDNLLVDKVKQQLHVLTAEETAKVKEQLADIERDDIIKGWINGDETTRKILEGINKDKINHYLELKRLSTEVRASVETENHIYNHLSLFFSRYYDKGDFISKRRFGKNEKYVVPYNGEETHFHWANQDQYYVKSSETFQKFAFKVPTQSGYMVVNFKLTAAQVEQGNVKADEANYFILSDKPAEFNDDETSFFFEYRPLTDEEKKNIKGNSKQDSLNEMAYEHIRQETQAKVAALNALWKTDDNGIALLLKKINHYTRKNKYDFFIHKNLKGFLERELDFYIKSELINVDDLYVSEAETHFNRLKHNLKSIKVFKSIADTIIAFVSQIEDFQKKLWEKKKFVLSTEWVITIDRLVEYIGLEAATPILEEVIKNEKQVAEWVELFGDENVPKTLSIDTLKADLHEWRKLPVDTKYFTAEFKQEFISMLSENNLSDILDGFIMQSDNFHGLSLLQDSFDGKIAATYIDPPYNTGDDGFIYKDSFRSSSWVTMFQPLLNLNKDIMSEESSLFVSCDEHEELSLGQLLNVNYGEENRVEKITWNKRIPKNDKGIGNIHEYIYLYSKNQSYRRQVDLSYLMRKEFLAEVYEVVKKAKAAGKTIQEAQILLKQYYRRQGLDRGITLYCELDENYEVWGKINMSWPNAKTQGPRYEVINPVTLKPTPVPNKGWRWKEETFRLAEKDGREFTLPDGSMMKGRIWYASNESTQPSSVTYLREVESFLLRSIISQKSDGGIVLEQLKLQDKIDYPKPTKLIEFLLYATSISEGYFLDYFAGSGTTFHAIQNLNNQDSQKRKCILIEQGDYFYSVIIPRIKKIAYTFDWKDGKPKDKSMNGLGVFFKYQRLEQYEESLENIAFTAPGEATQMALKVDSYLPKYFLDFETRGSQALVNTTAMQDPWNYTLKVWDGFTYDTEQAVDLVETFNYLIGLHMQKCFTKQINGKKYQFIHGYNNANKKIVVVWRNVKDWTLDDYRADGEALNAELKEVARDLLYINDQANVDNYQPIEEVFKNKMLP